MNAGTVRYAEIAAAVEQHGFVLRGQCRDDDGNRVVMVGNVSTTMWPYFEADRMRRADPDEPDPLDAWTRRCLEPIAQRFGATFVHPSDEPFRPFQRWAQRAESVWPSPIGLLLHPTYGLWHAYRGAFVFPPADPGGAGESTIRVMSAVAAAGGEDGAGLASDSPCVSCHDKPCLSACPVDAFSEAGYDADACRSHIVGGTDPDCLHQGCHARCACPVGAGFRYGPAQMFFHMKAFVGDSVQVRLETDR